MDWPKEILWFNGVGTCRCGKPAHGWLMGPRNEKWGVACVPCANKALRAANKARAAASAGGRA